MLQTHPSGPPASRWIRFLRGYGPVPRNEVMYDEFIRRTASQLGVNPLQFQHPASTPVLEAITGDELRSVVLTGTAGDGKTYLCRQVWERLGGDARAWQRRDPHLSAEFVIGGETVTLHVIRDLSAWAPQRGTSWPPEREAVLQSYCESVLGTGNARERFLIAANDGQLMDAWHRLEQTPAVAATRELMERMLVEGKRREPGAALDLFNLSQHSSAELLDLAIDALVSHDGWSHCRSLDAPAGEFFGSDCPVRHNYELLQTPLVRRRLRELLELCDYNRVHIPIRQLLLLLANGLLGHPDAPAGLLSAEDVPGVIRAGTAAKASLYDNLFGGNLTESARENRLIFDALSRFGIGYETSNRVDNVLIFGEDDEVLRPYFDRYLAADPFYGADAGYRAAQRKYIEGADEDPDRAGDFLRRLVGQRRGLFFKIENVEADDLGLWQLTVFASAGEYLERVVHTLGRGERVDRPILARLVRGLNRIFTGMLIGNDRELFLATDITVSSARVSRLLEDRISVDRRYGQQVDVVTGDGLPTIEVTFTPSIRERLELTLTRFEFLSRVAAGALPNSFSKECYEDLLAFKSRLLAAGARARRDDGPGTGNAFAIELLSLGDAGDLSIMNLEVRGV